MTDWEDAMAGEQILTLGVKVEARIQNALSGGLRKLRRRANRYSISLFCCGGWRSRIIGALFS
jgi:hypothetical protein